MRWFIYLLMGLQVLNIVFTINSVGKRRMPLEPGAAAIAVVFSMLILLGLGFTLNHLS